MPVSSHDALRYFRESGYRLVAISLGRFVQQHHYQDLNRSASGHVLWPWPGPWRSVQPVIHIKPHADLSFANVMAEQPVLSGQVLHMVYK